MRNPTLSGPNLELVLFRKHGNCFSERQEHGFYWIFVAFY
jgi:hypothetical protein